MGLGEYLPKAVDNNIERGHGVQGKVDVYGHKGVEEG